jgi:hypothetical protein
MAINIKNAEVDRLIQQLRELTGQGPTEIVKAALEREYREQRRQRRQTQLAEHLPTIQLESEISKQLEFRYGLSSTDARNAYSKAEAAYASFVELVNLYIDEGYESIKAVNKSIKKLEKQLVKAQKQWDEFTIKRIKKKLHYKTNKIQSLQAKIVKHQEQRDSGRFSITFGSSRLFDKHHRLEINGYKNHQEWLEDWRAARSNRIYYEGAKLFIAGNQLCKYNPIEQTLTLTVPPCLVDKYGKIVTLHGINFNYGSDWLLDALTPVKYPDGKQTGFLRT